MAGCTEISVNVQVYTKQYNLRLDLTSDVQPALTHILHNNYVLHVYNIQKSRVSPKQGNDFRIASIKPIGEQGWLNLTPGKKRHIVDLPLTLLILFAPYLVR